MALSLKALRQAAGVTQSALAKRARIHQPNLSLIESGKTDPSFSLVENYLANLDLKLVAVPKSMPDVQGFVDDIEVALSSGNEERAFRLWADLDNRLRKLDGTLISVALALEIRFTSSDRYNALLDGLFEYHLNNNNAPVPHWMRNKKFVLQEPWNTAGELSNPKSIAANSPEEFFDRNVFLHWKDLISV